MMTRHDDNFYFFVFFFGIRLSVFVFFPKSSSPLLWEMGKPTYVGLCRELGCEVDQSVLISIETSWKYLKASSSYSLLPLLLLIQETSVGDQIQTFRVKKTSPTTHLADANARVVASIMSLCPNLISLDVSGMGLSPFGAREIVGGLGKCNSLQKLNLSQNPGIAPALADGDLEEVLRTRKNLIQLDVTNDLLGFDQVKRLTIAMKACHQKSGKRFEILGSGNNVFEEVLNALTHGIGTLFAIIGSFVLMSNASAEGQTRRTFYASLVYCASLVFLFISSTLLHAAFLNERASSVLAIMDHAAIYLLIAGSSLPFCIISLEQHPYGATMAIAEWVLAFIGIILCFVAERIHIPGKMAIELALYLTMGWMLSVSFEDFAQHLTPQAFDLLLIGGLVYSGGVVFFILEKTTHPIGHAVWHIFVLVGAICHYFAILLFVVGLEEEKSTEICMAGMDQLEARWVALPPSDFVSLLQTELSELYKKTSTMGDLNPLN